MYLKHITNSMAGIDLKSLLANFTDLGNKKNSSGNKIGTKGINEALTAFENLNKKIDELNKGVIDYNKTIDDLRDKQKTLSRQTKEWGDIEKELIEKSKERKNLTDELNLSNKSLDNTLDRLNKNYGISVDAIEGQINAEKEFNQTKLGSIISSRKLSQGFADLTDRLDKAKTSTQGFDKLSGEIINEFGTISKIFSFSIEGIIQALKMAVNQAIELNDRLIKFQRDQSGTLNARMLGYDVFGNNQGAGSGSLTSLSARNNVSVDQMLESFKSFSQGSAIGLTADLNNSQASLQKFGVEFAKTEKLYGVNAGVLQKFSETFLYDFGMPINKVTDTLKKGADIALQAGINVNKFFENMAALGKSSLFTRNGIEGIEKYALALS